MSTWIPVAKEYPAELSWVLVWSPTRALVRACAGIWDGESFRAAGGEVLSVTHWMPMPEGPGVVVELPKTGRPRTSGSPSSVIRDLIEASVGWVQRRDLKAELRRRFPKVSPVRLRDQLNAFCQQAAGAGNMQIRNLRKRDSAVLWCGPVSSTDSYEARKRALGI